MIPKRGHKQELMAKIWDGEIQPIWAERFGRMVLRGLSVPPKANVLDVGCTTGYPALEILRRMDEQGRIIAIDPSQPMLAVAREKAGPLSGKRIFFRSEWLTPKLSFADDVYDLVLSNLGLSEVDDPMAAVHEFARVAKPGGQVVATLPFDGSFAEFFDLFREVLIKRDRSDALLRLETCLARYPTPAEAEFWFTRAGLLDVVVEQEHFALLFKSSREFFFAPVIEFGPLHLWRSVAGKGQEMQDTFWQIKESIDKYFGDAPFSVTVCAGCIRGRKPREGEVPAKPARDAAAAGDSPEAGSGLRPIPERLSTFTGEIQLGTGEIDIIEVPTRLIDEDEDEDPI